MKWKLAIIVCSYVIGAGFLAAWQIEVEKRQFNPPGGAFNPKPIMWMMKTGFVFLFIGTTVFTHLIADKTWLFWKGLQKSDRD